MGWLFSHGRFDVTGEDYSPSREWGGGAIDSILNRGTRAMGYRAFSDNEGNGFEGAM